PATPSFRRADMPIRIACPHCSITLRINDDWMDERIRCPSCGQSFVGPRTPAAPAPAPSQKPAKTRPQPDNNNLVNRAKAFLHMKFDSAGHGLIALGFGLALSMGILFGAFDLVPTHIVTWMLAVLAILVVLAHVGLVIVRALLNLGRAAEDLSS